MKKIAVLLLLTGITVNYCLSQDQLNPWPGQYFKGYQESLAGEKIDYHSSHPGITWALLLRANKNYHAIKWASEQVPEGYKGKEAVFVWMYGIDADPKTFRINLKMNGRLVAAFTNPAQSSLAAYSVSGPGGTELTFRPLILDMFSDPMGYAILRVPSNFLIPGKEQVFEAEAEDKGLDIWYMTFEAGVEERTELSQEPVLVNGKNGNMMAVRADFTHLGQEVEAQVTLGTLSRQEILLHPGYNSMLLQYPEVKKNKTIKATVRIGDQAPQSMDVLLEPVKPWTIYLVQHAHTDVGYTRPQSEILPEHLRYIDFALDYCDQTDSFPDDAKFRWTCETSWAVREYIRTRSGEQVQRLLRRIKEGRIEVTGLFLNMSDLSDEASLATCLQPVKEFRLAGIPVVSAMQDDVNGLGWCLADYLPALGIKYMNMGQNTDRAIKPFNRPTPFWWESPSGSRLLVYRGEHYMWGNSMGILSGDMHTFGQGLFRDLRKFVSLGYPYDRIAVQFSGYFTDNSPPSTTVCSLVKKWNETYAYPHLRLATIHEFPEYLSTTRAKDIPVYRAAWPDWWTDGFGSAAIETAYARLNQSEMLANQSLLAMAMLKNVPLPERSWNRITALRDAVNFYDEHTFGAAESISDPRTENSTVQWGEKSSYVWDGLLQSRMLREDAMGLLMPFLPSSALPQLAVFNTLGMERSGVVEVFIDNQLLPADKPYRITDGEGHAVPFQLIRSRSEGNYWAVYAEKVPPFGYKLFRILPVASRPFGQMENAPFTGLLENDNYRLVLDTVKGVISSLRDKSLGLELVDQHAPWGMAQLIYEQLGNRNQVSAHRLDDFKRSALQAIRVTGFVDGPVWEGITLAGEMPGCAEKSGISIEVRLYKAQKRIELRYAMKKLPVTSPEGVYVALPFSLAGGHIAFESQGGIVVPGKDQLEGSSSDWNGVQNFASTRNEKAQVVISSPEIPLMMFGDINLGKFQRISNPQTTNVYSWVMNNYWTTNFRASQEGELKWKYEITSGADTADAFAALFGWGSRIPMPARVIPAGGTHVGAAEYSFIPGGTGTVMLISAYPASDKKNILIQLRESGGKQAEINLTDLLALPSVKSIQEVNAIEEPIRNDLQTVVFKPWEPKFLRINMK